LEKLKRPSEIIALLIVEALGGVFNFIEGLLNLFNFLNLNPTDEISTNMITLGKGLGLTLILIGIMSFLISYGLLRRTSWVWTGARYLAIFDIILGIFSFPASLLMIITDLVILYYLSKPTVKEYLGKS
jgi:hypothetical protein